MTPNTAPPTDRFAIRCRKLGHQISFSYCRTENPGLPCGKVLDCWHLHFEVRHYLKKELPPEEWLKAFAAPPKQKLMTLLDRIDQAKAAKQKDSHE